ncbi:MAG: hypothetical protein MJ177_00975 [Clostridia bacterium]|nr:hypothetical protein [Clostridia bacterium]
MKKIICIILSVLMLLPCVFSVSAEDTDTPIVYVEGQGATLVNADGEVVYNGILENLPDGYLIDAVKACMPSFVGAITLGSDEAWAAYEEKITEYVYPLFKDIQLDKNGEVTDGSHVNWSWNDDSIRKIVKNAQSGGYGLDEAHSFVFRSDWRLDPYVNAGKLNSYIADIKRITGADKVNLEARCEGGNIAMAYFDEYGYDDIKCCEFYVSSVNGVEYLGPIFSGKYQFGSESINRYKKDRLTLEDKAINDLLDAALKIATDTYGLDLAAIGLPFILNKLYDKVFQNLLLNTYGGLPGIWAIVSKEYYDDAKKTVFGGREDEYAGLIKKIEHYHDRISMRVDEVLTNGKNAGVRFAVFAKYGFQFLPVSENNDCLADNCVLLSKATYGATCAKYNKVLSDSYVKKAKENGTDRYLSPDNAVDCSTALFPDTTWVIKNSIHKEFPAVIHDFMMKFFRSGGTMTVFTDTQNAPQYMVYNGEDGTLTPMTKTDADVIVTPTPIGKRDFKTEFINFWKALWALIIRVLFNR